MVRWWIFLMVAMLAGCADGGAPPADEGLAADQEVEVTSDTGAIRGVVVDPMIVPVEGATVEASCIQQTSTTGADGSFAFSKVQPGPCFVTVTKTGYGTVQSSTEVVAGQERPPVLRIQIARLPGLEPSAQVVQWDGHIQCSVRFVVNALAACATVGALGDVFAVRYRDFAIPTFVQSEMVWDSTQQLGESLKVMYTDDDSGLDNFEVAQGPSPLVINTDKETLEGKHFDDRGLYIRVFTGDYQDTGLSLTVDQDFTVYTSWYWNYAPPEDWMFIHSAGLYPPPE